MFVKRSSFALSMQNNRWGGQYDVLFVMGSERKDWGDSSGFHRALQLRTFSLHLRYMKRLAMELSLYRCLLFGSPEKPSTRGEKRKDPIVEIVFVCLCLLARLVSVFLKDRPAWRCGNKNRKFVCISTWHDVVT